MDCMWLWKGTSWDKVTLNNGDQLHLAEVSQPISQVSQVSQVSQSVSQSASQVVVKYILNFFLDIFGLVML